MDKEGVLDIFSIGCVFIHSFYTFSDSSDSFLLDWFLSGKEGKDGAVAFFFLLGKLSLFMTTYLSFLEKGGEEGGKCTMVWGMK